MIKTFEEHKAVQESITEWRKKVGSLDSDGWYPYVGAGANTQLSENKEVTPSKVVKFGSKST
jgi:hypothetical protein